MEPSTHDRMKLMLEASDRPRSDLKDAPPPTTDPYLPDGIDVAAAFRRAVAGYAQDGVTLNTPPPARPKPITLSEAREDLAKRITDPIQRAYVILSGSDR